MARGAVAGETIVVRKLGKAYTIDKALGRRSQISAPEGLHLAVSEGELVTIIGPSGCGKSTFLMVAATRMGGSSFRARISRTPWRAPGSSSSGDA